MGSSSPRFGMKKKLSCHHLDSNSPMKHAKSPLAPSSSKVQRWQLRVIQRSVEVTLRRGSSRSSRVASLQDPRIIAGSKCTFSRKKALITNKNRTLFSFFFLGDTSTSCWGLRHEQSWMERLRFSHMLGKPHSFHKKVGKESTGVSTHLNKTFRHRGNHLTKYTGWT